MKAKGIAMMASDSVSEEYLKAIRDLWSPHSTNPKRKKDAAANAIDTMKTVINKSIIKKEKRL